jgi:hypothetical protein
MERDQERDDREVETEMKIAMERERGQRET